MNLEGRTALVTGASRGIGRAIARALAAEGARVLLLGRSEGALIEVAEQIAGPVELVVVDMGNPDDLGRAIARVEADDRGVDIVVNNAAVIGPLGPLSGTDTAAWSDALAVNLLGPIYLTRRLLPSMLDRDYGRIVNISSGAAEGTGIPSAGAYSVTKAALEMFSRNLAAELSETGVTCNAVRPGTVDTDMQTAARRQPAAVVGEEFRALFDGFKSHGQLISPEVPARLVARLVATTLNGHVIRVGDDLARRIERDGH